MEVLLEENLFGQAKAKEALFRSLLVGPGIQSVRSYGLWMAVAFDSFEACKRVIDRCIAQGLEPLCDTASGRKSAGSA